MSEPRFPSVKAGLGFSTVDLVVERPVTACHVMVIGVAVGAGFAVGAGRGFPFGVAAALLVLATAVAAASRTVWREWRRGLPGDEHIRRVAAAWQAALVRLGELPDGPGKRIFADELADVGTTLWRIASADTRTLGRRIDEARRRHDREAVRTLARTRADIDRVDAAAVHAAAVTLDRLVQAMSSVGA